MPAHDFYDKGARVRSSGGRDGVDGLADAFCKAVDAPMVMSVVAMSLSIEPTRPTMFRWQTCWPALR